MQKFSPYRKWSVNRILEAKSSADQGCKRDGIAKLYFCCRTGQEICGTAGVAKSGTKRNGNVFYSRDETGTQIKRNGMEWDGTVLKS